MEALLKALMQRREEMEAGVFTHPASSWEEYQKRLGRWVELSTVINLINGKIEEQDT